ncbi:MAG: phosphoribosylamine--glycine ligase [Niastella sp.]|nr:phosphoribosylamine--glycine ligase [Niastella sp.]
MNILLIGSGGREHALAKSLKQSKKCENLFIAPGNAGTALCGTNLLVAITDFEQIASHCILHKIDMLIVGPEEPLVKGIVGYLQQIPELKNMAIIGPADNAAQLEGSKAYAKIFMKHHGIPTAAYKKFTQESYKEGVEYIKKHSLPIVLKADGLAGGKGVVICQTHIEAISEFELMLLKSKFGEAGKKVVVEEFLEGIEMSVFVLTDGENYVLLPEAKDYKRIGEGDTGPNTGGMGAVSPVPFFDETLKEQVIQRIIQPTIDGIKKDKLEYKGFLFFGLMITTKGPYVIEYNCRMGDPETEVVIPRIKNDLVDLLLATYNSHLSDVTIETTDQQAVAIVAVSGGYPGIYEKGKTIYNLQNVMMDNSTIYHAGTKYEGNEIITNGGRVLVVTSFADTIEEATFKSNYILQHINFEGMNYRSDIGYEFKN